MDKLKILEQLQQPNVVVIIKNEYEKERIVTIGADTRYEHPLTPLAIKFKESLIEQLKNNL